MVGLGPICQQLVFAARPEYLSLTYHYMSGCSKYIGTTCMHIPTTNCGNRLGKEDACDRTKRQGVVKTMTIRVCTFFTFLSDRLVYMILRGQIDPKHQCKKFFFKILSS